MIKSLHLKQNNYFGSADNRKSPTNKETHLLDDKFSTHVNSNIQKVESAFIDYPVKGLSGDINSNFYEFLAMGVIPYIAGSAMFIALFNIVNKHLDLFSKEKADIVGKKLGLGVILFGLLKGLSKSFVTKPVSFATGVNINKPYVNKVFNLPKGDGKTNGNDTVWQQRTVFDSKEFYRKDLLSKDYYAKVAEKLGLGKNLNDPASETSPIIQNIIATTKTAVSISSYCWGALGVGLASQEAWTAFFKSFPGRTKFTKSKESGLFKNATEYFKNFGKNTFKISENFVKAFLKSFAQMWKSKPSDSIFVKHTGKFVISGCFLVTSALTLNAILRAKKAAKLQNDETIDRTKEVITL